MFLPGWLVELFIPTRLEESIQPAGVDLSVWEVYRFKGPGIVGREGRLVANAEPVEPTGGFWRLEPGAYRIVFREIVRVPEDVVGFCYPRSTLLRSGATVLCAVWDPGYIGRGQALLIVFNPYGIVIERGARVAQLVYARVNPKPRETYRGIYFGEGL